MNKKKKETIFVQIASYRDSELEKTIDDLIQKAKFPTNLVIVICRQFHPDDKFDELAKYRNDIRFKIIDVPYNKTNGVCWARHQIQQLYNGEDYTLQLDSHHRFVKDWDVELIKMIKDLQKIGHEKPLLTAYLPAYTPNTDPIGRVMEPWQMSFDRFIPEGAIFFLPVGIHDWKRLKYPVKGRYYSAHFCFTLGQFCKEVQHNPNYLFHGEEISIAVRAYTWGYDIFHPHKVIAWHEYTRDYRTKAWDDDKKWNTKNIKSHTINRKLFGMDGEKQSGHNHPKLGFGKIRTVKSYEKYAGIKFSTRGIQEYTRLNLQPPNPYIKDDVLWEKSINTIFRHCIDVAHSLVPEKDYEFWVVAVHDKNDNTLYRKDLIPTEIDRLMGDKDGYCKIWVEFETKENPSYWVVWPYSKSKEWCSIIKHNIY